MSVPTPENTLSPAGRFAPSPSGDLHLGNLRTALAAWGFARTTGHRFLLRVEDLDRVKKGAAERNVADLRELGLDWDGPVALQSERIPQLLDRVRTLTDAGLTYECYCTRREIHAAASAPHGIPGAYPGTCRELSAAQRERRRAQRPPALRLRADVTEFTVRDELAGPFTGAVDDMVLVRNDGTPAYNLAVVVDDAEQGVDQVVRGDDLLDSTPRQRWLAAALCAARGEALPQTSYLHVPLVLNAEGRRLAKRDGAVTLEDLAAADPSWTPERVRDRLLSSLGLPPGPPADAVPAFARMLEDGSLPREPWMFDPAAFAGA